MSPRFVCLQGHLWTYDDHEKDQAMFCPVCGLRLYAESQAPTLASSARALTAAADPTPFRTADIWRFNRSSIDGVLPAQAIQPNDIETIPGYELLGILGRGGMGIVFRARQLSLKRQVALKMILTGRHARASERARFQREAEAVARLQHTNIVQIYEVGEQNGLPYCALEFVNAGSLAQFLGGSPQMPRLAAKFLHGLAQTMHYAHKKGIVHRDLKPANILLQLDESQILKNGHLADTALFRNLLSYVPKISDFGLAKNMGGEEGPYRLGAIIGTPSYMAPEQARGTSGQVGPAADVYAFGAILYEMLTGRPPFQGATPEETAQLVLTQDPVPPTQLHPKIPKDLETICLVCLQKDPAHRYASAEALADDLQRFVENEPILARRTHLPERVVKWATRRPLLAACAMAGLTLMSLFWWIWWDRAVTSQTDREEIFHAWQKSDDQLQDAMNTIDAMVNVQPTGADKTSQTPAAVLGAKMFYERLLDKETSPARRALAYYRLAKIHDRLKDAASARTSYLEAIACWETAARQGPISADAMHYWQESRRRLQP